MSNNGNVIPFGKSARELPEEAYTNSSIGNSLVEFFQQVKFTREQGLNILDGMQEYLEHGSSDVDNVQSFITSFTDHGAKHVEVLAGVAWVREQMVEIDEAHTKAVDLMLQELEEYDDDESPLH